MTENDIAPNVLALIDASIHSLEDLELLLLLRNAAPRALTIAQLGAQLDLSAESVRLALQNLISGSLVAEIAADGAASYHYAPSTADARRSVDDLLTEYAMQRAELMMLISKRAIERVRRGVLEAFSGVFRSPGGSKRG